MPEEISTLLEELDAFKNVLAAICVLMNQRSGLDTKDEAIGDLQQLLVKAKAGFTTIATHCGITIQAEAKLPLEDTAALLESAPQVNLLGRFRWLKDRKRIESYRKRVKCLRLDIANHLAALSL